MPAHMSTKSSLGGWLSAASSATEQAVGTELKYSMLKIKCDSTEGLLWWRCFDAHAAGSSAS